MEDKFLKGKKVINKSIARINLKEVIKVFDNNNIPYCFIFGTLLGAIRENDFITYDNDIDLAAFWKDRDKILEVVHKELKTFTLEQPFLHDINLIRNNEKIEFWLFEDVGDKYIYDPTRCGKVKYDKVFFDNIINYNFLGMKVKVPSNPKKFLEITYGPTWITPNPNGSYILK
jgi:hypothetical protein